MSFSSPVAILANTIYTVSYYTGNSYFGISSGYFNSGGVTNGPLQALSNSSAGGNGVYQYAGDFPNVSGSGMNFWVDVAFSPSSTTSVKPSSVVTSTGGVEFDGDRTIGLLRHPGRRGHAVGADRASCRGRRERRPRTGRRAAVGLVARAPRRIVIQSRDRRPVGAAGDLVPELIADGSRPHRTAHRGSERPPVGRFLGTTRPNFSRLPIRVIDLLGSICARVAGNGVRAP